MYVHKSLSFTRTNVEAQTENQHREIIACEIKLSGGDKLLAVSVYRSPNSTCDNNTEINSALKKLSGMGHSHVICMGDFNYPQIDWDSYLTTGTIEDASFLFIECVHGCYWEQHVKEPTRGRGTDKTSLLDLVLTNEEGMVQELDIEAPLGASDHVTFKC